MLIINDSKRMFKTLTYLFGVKRKKRLTEWLRTKYEPSIRYYNESDRFDPLSHLLIDLGETYLNIRYNEVVRKDFGISEHEFNCISREVYDELVHFYFDGDCENLDNPLYIR